MSESPEGLRLLFEEDFETSELETRYVAALLPADVAETVATYAIDDSRRAGGFRAAATIGGKV